MIFYAALRRARSPRPGVVSGLPGGLTRSYLLGGRPVGKAQHLALRAERHRLMLAAVDDRWYAPWRRVRRLRRLAQTEADLTATGLPW